MVDTRLNLMQVYREHERELLRFLARRLGSMPLATDIAHDVYVKLLGAAEHSAIHNRKAYLFRIAANLATDHLRAERRRHELLARDGGVLHRQTDELTPERYVLARAELQHLERVIAGLPERCRQVFDLHRCEGRSYAEIATILEMSSTTVYKDLNLALDRLVRARWVFRQGTDSAGDNKARRGSHLS